MASDRRAYVRIPDAILREPWEDATLADMVRLQAFLNTRWARDHLTAEEAGRAFLGPQEMMLITRTNNVTRARKRLLALHQRTAGVTLAVSNANQGRCRGVRVEWPKFPIEQGYRDRGRPKLGGNLGVTQPRSDTAPASASEEQDPQKDLGADAPPWGPLRNLRRKVKASELIFERFLRDNYGSMEAWRKECVAEGLDLPSWPSVVIRFWNQRNRKPWESGETREDRIRRISREFAEEEKASAQP